jgi:hypothetical protein
MHQSNRTPCGFCQLDEVLFFKKLPHNFPPFFFYLQKPISPFAIFWVVVGFFLFFLAPLFLFLLGVFSFPCSFFSLFFCYFFFSFFLFLFIYFFIVFFFSFFLRALLPLFLQIFFLLTPFAF